MNDRLFSRFDEEEVEYKRNVNMSALTTVKTGGICNAVIYPSTDAQLVLAINLLRAHNEKYKVIGNMSNVLPPDGTYSGALISTKRLLDVYHEGKTVVAECGAVSSSVFGYALRHGLGGAEALSGIPGTVGGMAYSNAGAFGYEFSDFFISGRVYIPDERKILTLGREELNFKYRESIFSKREMYLLSAKLSLREVSREDSLLKIKEFKRRREETQPIGTPSLGSVFKRGHYGAPARLIDKLGLKGYSVGGAEVSDKHAGFIVNRRNASSSDFKAVLRHVKESVYNEYGAVLELEIEMLS